MCPKAGGVGWAIPRFVLVDHSERAPASAADVLPGRRAKCPYTFAPNPNKRVFTLVRSPFIGTTSMYVVIDILCVSRRRSGRCRDAKRTMRVEIEID